MGPDEPDEFEMAPDVAWRAAADAKPELHDFIKSDYNAREYPGALDLVSRLVAHKLNCLPIR